MRSTLDNLPDNISREYDLGRLLICVSTLPIVGSKSWTDEQTGLLHWHTKMMPIQYHIVSIKLLQRELAQVSPC